MTEMFEGDLYDEGTKYKDDGKLVVAFYKQAVKNNFKSTQEGRPIYEDKDFIKIIIPGSRDVTEARVTEQYKDRFPRQWAAYQNKQQVKIEGTPLSELTWMGRSMVAEFNACNVQTVEQLVGMADVEGSKFMGWNQIKQRCERYLQAAKGEAPALVMEKQVADLSKENETLKAQMADLAAEVKVLRNLATPQRGRPPKVVEEA
jgi:hypothetical protein